ncbi:HEAT repeat domain-containing protein [Mesoflavibacter sp. SCSIO 43206]|uniref:HEAT repeat domain-containing protein n=1 Tax=Mesoflavibacter sp. SCSIO 43206 TaxID=2779362 RepID=UPI001CA7CA69|nr:HEAT repeat domain-containing protein [Mesoflavibacter sp. SCSIO 43206]UAB75637.1 HEAT repeat domain-containing protein [Mesoflavibacter sp. SCSIO 43206]
MGILKNIFGKKAETVEKTTPKVSEYFIDIDPNSDSLSKAFKDFYKNHFINAYGLSRNEVDTYFFNSMSENEKEIAKRLIRQNLKLRQSHLFKAAGILKDKQALPILYDQLNTNTNLSWLLVIGQAIWRINGDDIYPKLLSQLKEHSSDTMREAHFDQIVDLKNKESIEMLFSYLSDKSRLVQYMAISKLNFLSAGKHEQKQRYDKKYFMEKKTDEKFKNDLLEKLKKT